LTDHPAWRYAFRNQNEHIAVKLAVQASAARKGLLLWQTVDVGRLVKGIDKAVEHRRNRQ